MYTIGGHTHTNPTYFHTQSTYHIYRHQISYLYSLYLSLSRTLSLSPSLWNTLTAYLLISSVAAPDSSPIIYDISSIFIYVVYLFYAHPFHTPYSPPAV